MLLLSAQGWGQTFPGRKGPKEGGREEEKREGERKVLPSPHLLGELLDPKRGI
jgi:hypothetical protein